MILHQAIFCRISESDHTMNLIIYIDHYLHWHVPKTIIMSIVKNKNLDIIHTIARIFARISNKNFSIRSRNPLFTGKLYVRYDSQISESKGKLLR